MTDAGANGTAPSADLAALARGGRINFFGFVLRLMARLPFLFIAGRMYGAEQLGRFAYAVLIVEFAAQLATLCLKRGLAQQLAKTDKPHVCVVADALLVAAIGSAIAMTILAIFPQAMFPNSEITGLEWTLPITVFALAWSTILAAVGYAALHLNRSSRRLAWLNRKIFPLYIVHQTVVVAALFHVLPLDAGVWTKFLLVLGATFAGSFIFAILADMLPSPLKPLVGLSDKSARARSGTVAAAEGRAAS